MGERLGLKGATVQYWREQFREESAEAAPSGAVKSAKPKKVKKAAKLKARSGSSFHSFGEDRVMGTGDLARRLQYVRPANTLSVTLQVSEADLDAWWGRLSVERKIEVFSELPVGVALR